MTPEQFIEEVHQSSIMPSDFDKVYEDFCKYQQMVIATLNEFHRVCEKNNIPYQLAFGSLLGAIRDNGQIPWDYDVDVYVPHSERTRLIEVLAKDLQDDFYVYCPEVNPKCRHMILRIAPKGYRSEVLHVDVFFITGAPQDQKEFKKYAKKIRTLFDARFYKLVDIAVEAKGHPKHAIKLWLYRMKHIFIPVKKGFRQYMKLCDQYPIEESERFINANQYAETYKLPADSVLTTMIYETAIGTFRISTKYDVLLTEWYSDYHRIPSLESRLKELYSSYKRIKKFENLH